MSVIGNTSGEDRYPAVKFANLGDSVAGRIAATEDYQVKDFSTQELKTFKDGNPIMGVRIILEMRPGDETSRVTLWAQGKRMLEAIAKAVKGTGAPDLEIGADLAVSYMGRDGQAKTYQAAYARPEESADSKAA